MCVCVCVCVCVVVAVVVVVVVAPGPRENTENGGEWVGFGRGRLKASVGLGRMDKISVRV